MFNLRRSCGLCSKSLLRRNISSKPPPITQYFLNGEFYNSESNKFYDVINPCNQELLTKVPEITTSEFNKIVESSNKAQNEWKKVPIVERQRLMNRYCDLLYKYKIEIAESISLEHGKTMNDSIGDVMRGIEVVEYSRNIVSLLTGRVTMNGAKDIDIYSWREPIGVCAGIAPFNFPAMIPLWMYPLAIVCGNSFILKPSEKTPTATKILCELFNEIKEFPKGLLNVVHGGIDCVNQICDNSIIAGVSFVGSNRAGEHIASRCVSNGNNKKFQCNMGAKNHGTIIYNEDEKFKTDTIRSICNAAFGTSGQRCMALPVIILVGKSKEWLNDIKKYAEENMYCNSGINNYDTNVIAPITTKESLLRIEKIIENCIQNKDGSEIILDGRISDKKNNRVKDYPNGNFIGPTIINNINENMECYKEEIFGPVMLIKNVDTISEAIKFTNNNPYGNGCAIFTKDLSIARKFKNEINVGQIGVNIPIPVPFPWFEFSGGKRSFIGGDHFYGLGGINHYTYQKTSMEASKYYDRFEIETK